MTRRLGFSMAVLVLAACGPPEAPPDAGDSFLAFPTSFKGYAQWESFALQSTAVAGSPHNTGERKVFLSHRPERGASEYPLGTMIVKQLPGEAKVFAMAKRGGGYNPGAPGWEWFELEPIAGSDAVVFVWRGVGPPTGEGYGGDPNGCNVCHAASKANDYVQSPMLQLSGL